MALLMQPVKSHLESLLAAQSGCLAGLPAGISESVRLCVPLPFLQVTLQ